LDALFDPVNRMGNELIFSIILFFIYIVKKIKFINEAINTASADEKEARPLFFK
jgi:hypothetical protein